MEWEEGDVLLFDNKAMAHARMNVDGKRTVVAGMVKCGNIEKSKCNY